jgi:hypothetical protein
MRWRSALIGVLATAVLPGWAWAASDWAAVGKALGRPGAVQAGGIYKVGLPRSDLKVTVDGVALKPALALGSWLAFGDMGDRARVMGDLVLTETEVSPVMKVLLDNGIQVTALHNHLLRATPMTFYMHVEGQGDAVKLAEVLHSALAQSGTPLTPAPAAAAPAPIELDTAKLDAILGRKGTVNGGVYQFAVPRAATPMAGGMPIPPPMGSAIAINFQPTGGGKAAVSGDFVLSAAEVSPVMRALRTNGIEVTALHNHMLDDEPRLFFMHFWANDDAQKLARGLRAALDQAQVAAP